MILFLFERSIIVAFACPANKAATLFEEPEIKDLSPNYIFNLSSITFAMESVPPPRE